jgi:hypothetical protein
MVGAKLGRREYPHYFAPLLPPAIMLACLPFSLGRPALDRILAPVALLLLVVVSAPFAVDVIESFGRSPDAQAMLLFGKQSVVWTKQEEVGEWLRVHAAPEDRLFVEGAEPGFYWQSGLTPASKFLYDYPGRLIPSFDKEVRCALLGQPPKFLVMVSPAIPKYLDGVLPNYHEVKRFDPVSVFQLDRKPQAVCVDQ